MRHTRDPLVGDFLSSLTAAFAAASLDGESSALLHRIGGALEKPGRKGTRPSQRLPVCGHLEAALSEGAAASPHLARLAEAFRALEPSLGWRPRPAGGSNASPGWEAAHANALIVGPAGLEERTDLMIGVSLLAPHTRYPDHNHAPEEVYLVMTGGRFQHGNPVWFEPGPGGTLYNEPDIQHAMASDADPLLAFWCLWSGPRD